jgi:Mn-dependent DtxR family transcriptional regulator
MPRTFPIRLEVEEIALGAVLRKLNDMPGIAKLHLDLERGGEGAGREKLEQHATEKAKDKGGRQAIVIKLLMEGPKNISEISRVLGGKASRAYGIMTQLRKGGLSEAAPGSAMHQLTKKALAQLGVGATKALPAPAITHGPKGRATPGSANIMLRTVLADGALSPADVRTRAAGMGVSPKGISGMLARAKRDGLIKKNGSGYELTAKGQKIEIGASANG